MLISVLSGLLCGIVAALVAALLARRFPNRGRAFSAISAGVFVLLASLSQTLVVPEVRAHQARRAAFQAVDQNPLLRTLAGQHPEIREKFAALIADAVKKGGTREEVSAQALAFGRGLVEPYFSKYAPVASNEALNRYIKIMVEVLDDLGSRDPNGCFSLLFGQGMQGSGAAATISEAHKKEMGEATAAVVVSAIQRPAPAGDPSRAQALLVTVTERMAARHGERILSDLQALANPADPGIDRAGACRATREMYREALGLPPSHSGALLRYLFTPEPAT